MSVWFCCIHVSSVAFSCNRVSPEEGCNCVSLGQKKNGAGSLRKGPVHQAAVALSPRECVVEHW